MSGSKSVFTDNVGISGYFLERSTDGVSFTIRQQMITDLRFEDRNLAANMGYWYRVTALDTSQNPSIPGNVVLVAILPDLTPDAGTLVNGGAASDAQPSADTGFVDAGQGSSDSGALDAAMNLADARSSDAGGIGCGRIGPRCLGLSPGAHRSSIGPRLSMCCGYAGRPALGRLAHRVRRRVVLAKKVVKF